MIQFEKLRLSGFKSFVDRTEIEIGPGLTGVVGPNGCGKSNLVEALRWSMGESSTKKMRGGSGSMDDVIFNGTQNRPARNVAEVSVLLSNADESAPAPYTTTPEIEVVRRIERDKGSAYRINGKACRARDVQLLYADILSGANSPFLISQGKITDIINAKPLNRRAILEEAAGISGLHARRHEAELRLRGADNNLKRLEDILGSMESRYQSLKKQVRQAARYRNLSEEIRRLEILIHCVEYLRARETLQDVEKHFAAKESTVAEYLTSVTQLTKTQNTQAADLPELRQAEAEAAAALQKHTLTLQRIEDEENRLNEQITEIESQREQLVTDRKDVSQNLEESSYALENINKEEKRLLEEQENAGRRTEELETAVAHTKNEAEKLEAAYQALSNSAAADQANMQSLERQIFADEQRLESIQKRILYLEEDLTEKKEDNKDLAEVETLRKEYAALEKDVEKATKERKAAEDAYETAREKADTLTQSRRDAEDKAQSVEREIRALQSVLETYESSDFKPVLDDIKAKDGFETALACALSDSLMASLNKNAPTYWHGAAAKASDSVPALPDDVPALATFIAAPPELETALNLIGVVDDEDAGNVAFDQLSIGQSLVSKDGYYWRWDGLHRKQTASDKASQQLKQKNKLSALEKELPSVTKTLEKAQASEQEAQDALSAAKTQMNDAIVALSDKEQALKTLSQTLQNKIEAQTETQTEIAKLEEALSLAKENADELKGKIKETAAEKDKYDQANIAAQNEKLAAAKAALREAREAYQKAAQDNEIFKQEQSRKTARIRAIGDERVNLNNKTIRGKSRLTEMTEREQQLTEKLDALKNRPKNLQNNTEELLSMIKVAEERKSEISDKLQTAETELAETTRALKEAEQNLSSAKESRAHAMATIEERRKQLHTVIERIQEQFEIDDPNELFSKAEMDIENPPALDGLKQQKDKAVRDRDMIGPVNLRAEQEIEELESELGDTLKEKNDLNEAIAELRQAIDKLNSEAKERLEKAFNIVNEHFRSIFTRLFNGGRAHLSLVESDDPMMAGLEIYAQPPGKALQSLSLLSGGEQTMTAVALIFAMFLTNPSPICVMDEVDAPLDDANVDRFCDLLEEFAERGETRFLVITHHRLTMARMDRLYGVTMAERGVSQLVSVDLNQQLDFLEAAE